MVLSLTFCETLGRVEVRSRGTLVQLPQPGHCHLGAPHSAWGPGCCHLLTLSLMPCSSSWSLPARHSPSTLGTPRFRSSGMLVGISQALLPKPITCVSIVLIVAFKIITGCRVRTGRALWICTGAGEHRCVWNGISATWKCFSCLGEWFACQKQGMPQILTSHGWNNWNKVSPCPPLHLPWGKNPPAPGSAVTDPCSLKLQLFPPSHI